jgi:hypothetical protein
MTPDSDIYEDVALIYTRLIEHDCPDAAAAITQIHSQAGSLAAMRAALVIRLLQIEVQQNHYFPNLGIYAYLFEHFPEVVSLLEQAITCCLSAWRIQGVSVQLQKGNLPQLIG